MTNTPGMEIAAGVNGLKQKCPPWRGDFLELHYQELLVSRSSSSLRFYYGIIRKKISPPGYMWRVFYGGIVKKEMLNAVFSSSYTIDGEISSLKRMDLWGKDTFILCFVSKEYSYSFVRNFTKSKNQTSDKRTHSWYKIYSGSVIHGYMNLFLVAYENMANELFSNRTQH